MTPDELRRMDMDQCIIFVKGLRPVKTNKFYYFKHPMAKQLQMCEISHNDIGEIERGTWRKYNPYNPYKEDNDEQQIDNLKVESLDDLFEDVNDTEKEPSTIQQPQKIENNSNQTKNGLLEQFEQEDDEDTLILPQEEDTYDLQKELEAKFDELFGPLEDE